MAENHKAGQPAREWGPQRCRLAGFAWKPESGALRLRVPTGAASRAKSIEAVVASALVVCCAVDVCSLSRNMVIRAARYKQRLNLTHRQGIRSKAMDRNVCINLFTVTG